MRCISALIASLCAVALIPDGAAAQSSSGLVSKDPSAQYRIISTIVGKELSDKHTTLYFDKEHRTLDLEYCSDYHDLGASIGRERPDVSRLTSVAFDVAILRQSLTSVGYPSSVWDDFVQERERSALSGKRPGADDMRGLRRLAALLNDYRRRGHRDLPAVVVEGGCGAGGTSVSFETSPPGGRVLLVPKMYYSLCRLQGLDPDDDRHCDFWQEVFPGQSPDVSGDYYAKIVWPDHSVIRSFSAAKLSDGVNRVTLR